MKEYPSIDRTFREIPGAYIFDKLDGSNLRFMWTRKKGWHRYGTRHRLFDESDPDFGSAIGIFRATIAEGVEKVAKDNRWEQVIVFAEFYGRQSFAGYHVADDPKTLTVFDVNPYKKGILGPREFLRWFGDNPDIPTAPYLGTVNWTRGFVDRVWEGQVDGVTFEGVIGKSGEGHKLVMAKAKTKVWIEQVRTRFAAEEAEKIVNS